MLLMSEDDKILIAQGLRMVELSLANAMALLSEADDMHNNCKDEPMSSLRKQRERVEKILRNLQA